MFSRALRPRSGKNHRHRSRSTAAAGAL